MSTTTIIRRAATASVGFVFGLSLLTGVAGASPLDSHPNSSSSADQICDGGFRSDTGHGANTDGPSNQYHNTCDTSGASGNGDGNGLRTGEPDAGTVGNADDKNPPGQYPNGGGSHYAGDQNNGYECDGNHGIALSNPAHTGCQDTTVVSGGGDDNGSGGSGDNTPPPVCPTDATMLTSYHYVINGTTVVNDLTGNVHPGDTVEDFFTVAAGCDAKVLSLASYSTAPSVVLSDSDTGTFGSGAGSLEVVVPSCAFEVDFVMGAVLPGAGSAAYGSNLIDDDAAGTACQQAGSVDDTPPPANDDNGDVVVTPPVVSADNTPADDTPAVVLPDVVTPSSVLSTPAVVESVVDASTFTTPSSVPAAALVESATVTAVAPAAPAHAEVLGEQIVRPADQSLARTGSNLVPLGILGLGLVAIGALLAGANRKRSEEEFASAA